MPDSPEDRSARIHRASLDPSFPARREAAFQTMLAAFGDILAPLGYTCTGSTWSRTSPQGRSAVHLQRSRYGWDVRVLLRFLTPDGGQPDTPGWPEDEDLSLTHFHPADAEEGCGDLAYLDVEENPARLAEALDIFSSRALPWLEAHHDDTPQKPETDAPPPVESINLIEKLDQFSDHWSPKIIAGFNGHDVMLVKLRGEFVWHSHPETDDLFLVLHGQLTIRLRDGEVVLNPGEMYVVPRGVEHCPFAAEEAHIFLIEPKGTPNTGDRATAAIKTVI